MPTDDVLVRRAFAIYAIFKATNFLRHVDNYPGEEIPHLLEQFARNGISGHDASEKHFASAHAGSAGLHHPGIIESEGSDDEFVDLQF